MTYRPVMESVTTETDLNENVPLEEQLLCTFSRVIMRPHFIEREKWDKDIYNVSWYSLKMLYILHTIIYISSTHLPLCDWDSWLGSGTLVCAVSNNSYVWSSSSTRSHLSLTLLLVYRACRRRGRRTEESRSKYKVKGNARRILKCFAVKAFTGAG